MFELTKVFKSAIVSLTEANRYLLMMIDFTGNYADDVEIEMFEKRQKLSPQEKEQALSDFEESFAMFAFVNLLPDGLLIMLYSLFDECLFSVTMEVSRLQGKPLNFKWGKTGRFTAEQSIQFLTDEVGIQVVDLCPSWGRIENIRKLRDIVIRDYRYVRGEYITFLQSLAQNSKNFSYEGDYKTFDFGFIFLSEIAETMILFFQELENPLFEISGQQP